MSKTITIGPYHPFLLEPERFDLQVEDDKITDIKITLGYIHRGIEQLITTKTYRQNVFLVERICGICSNAHTAAFCQTVEKILDIKVPDRAKYIRTIAAELERLHSHYLWLALLAHALDEPEYFLRIMRDREIVMYLLEWISGNRVHYAINTIEGIRRDLTPKTISAIKESSNKLKSISNDIVDALDERGVLGCKVTGIGVVSGEEAVKLGAVGPTLRGSGIESDIRKDEPYAAYPNVSFNVVVETGGDVRARSMVRARETLESISIIEQLLDDLPSSPIMGELKEPNMKEAIGRVEAPRGELAYYIKSNGTSIPERVKVRTPTFANAYFLTRALKGERLENARSIIESIDPCFACTDRMIIMKPLKNTV
jgi:NADH-quinone oxidoreductase subunit D